MQPIRIAASPLTYVEYRKLSLADFRTRYPIYYIGLPIFSAILLIILLIIIADTGIATLRWQDVDSLVLLLLVVVVVWGGTWFSLQRNYKTNETLKNGIGYRLDEQGITLDGSVSTTVLWSNIARNAVQSGQWIILRQASSASKEMYFLNTAAVLPPASRTELLALLKHKRIKRI
jgi:hypothetical protein